MTHDRSSVPFLLVVILLLLIALFCDARVG
jgi:hypothetical protein